ncbi:flagellar biosynthesis anti-sigma factor FlgM [Granulicella sp. L60]|jgi:negative regulator of flagellin synthesis FlgM|uniref:flagellar biosynthesis anti-sigma factor FlgM n=1 Tax=Granulicella sp. L60 TaxID=1641866 RepID=UPI00131BBDBB|nr:flagellar biosynthesis anti-sigma factor FlgM [Granulicella sp. L60]
MSFASGIGGLQQAMNSIASSETKPATRPEVSDGGVGEGDVSVTGAGQVDQANLSSAGGLVAQALEGSDVRSEKVSSLQQAIASGNYNVPSADVADKMVQSLLD